jgi:IS30 family transposase
MKSYAHLNKEERKVFAVMFQRGESLRAIGRALGRSHASFSRELKRNLTRRTYHPLHAELLSRIRMWECHHRPRLKSPALRSQVEARLRQKWSPEIIAGKLAKEYGRPMLSHEAIYQWVYTEARHLIRCLPYHHAYRGVRRLDRSKCLILGRVSVLERSQPANSRVEPGHWESDLVIGKGSSALKVTVERKSRYTRIVKVKNKSAQASHQALLRVFSSIPESLRKSITYDNGLENALHRDINERFSMESFFCFPGHCWEKPTVENTNGLIRWFLPKRTNFDIITENQILEIENWLNSRPRKCLDFSTPNEVLKHLTGALTC